VGPGRVAPEAAGAAKPFGNFFVFAISLPIALFLN